MARRPSVAIALGGGGARGIAHVIALEALDEMGIRPIAVAGTSMGAVIGAAYAAGLGARAIRAHVMRVLRNRSDVMGKLLRARVGRFSDLVLRGRGNPVLLDPEIFLELFWPAGMPEFFDDLAIKTFVVATNYSDCNEIVFSSGPLRPAVAGSMAIPGLFRPVESGDRVLIDGGAVNPLPYDLLFGDADIIIAIDVTYGGRSRLKRVPSPLRVDVWRGANHAGRSDGSKNQATKSTRSHPPQRRAVRLVGFFPCGSDFESRGGRQEGS